MEQFVVSARKYRPKGFEEVVGQEHITTTLTNAIQNNHLAQAFLFCGPRGVGKTTCARIVARMINGFDEPGNEQLIGGAPSHMNIYELDAASNNSVDDIRALVEQVRFPPQYGKYKVYIIDEVHMLSNQAFNAFLKTLEEPPPYAIFILATTEKHKVIPTILSRCQIFDFKRIQISDIVQHLAKVAEKEGIKAETEALNFIAQKADGAMRDALSLFDLIATFSSDNTITYKQTIDTLHILDHEYYFKATDMILREDSAGLLLLFDEILRFGFDAHLFIVGLSEHLRNLMVSKDAATAKLLPLTGALQKRYAEQAQHIDLSLILSGLSLLNTCDLHYKISKNQRLHVELTLIKLAFMRKAIQFADEEKKKSISLKGPQAYKIKEEIPSKVKDRGKITQLPATATPKLPKLSDIESKIKTGQQLLAIEENGRLANNDEIQVLWKELSEVAKVESRMNDHYFFEYTRPVVLLEELYVEVDNELELRKLAELSDFLKEVLQKRGFSAFKSIKPKKVLADNGIPEKKILYSQRERFMAMAEKNKTLLELKTRLGLDFD